MDFDKSVFINCPFDDEYRELLIPLIFAVMYLGFEPCLALDRSDSGESRVDKIIELIKHSKYGIHDLSRIISKGRSEHYRMNMPFELGIDYGCQKLVAGQWENKRLLILEKEKFRYQAALSDLSGSDIRHHNNEAVLVVKVVRDWFITEVLGKGPSPRKIWYDYNDFIADFEQNLISEGHEQEDFSQVPVPEIKTYMREWLLIKNIILPPVS